MKTFKVVYEDDRAGDYGDCAYVKIRATNGSQAKAKVKKKYPHLNIMYATSKEFGS